MVKRFFSVRVPVFGTAAMLVLCMVFFLLPFALRGARMAITDMQNNVADWLPGHFPETIDLNEFRKYFAGDQFVVVSGTWCKEGEGAFINLVRKIREESLEYEKVLKETNQEEELRAHRLGDELGLLYTGNYRADWGQEREKWLLGRKGQWYFIDRQGRLFEWDGQNNVIQGAKRSFERMLNGKNKANGTYVDTFGSPPDDEKGTPNPFYADPQKLCARPFKSVSTGPEIFEKMAGPDGTIKMGKFNENDLVTFQAQIEAHKRLTGSMFGPTPSDKFKWTFESLLQQIDDKDRLAELRSNPIHRERFDTFISQELESKYSGEFSGLLNATKNDKLDAWYRMWDELAMEAPPRQTCLIVTLNEPVINELARAVGRPLLGKHRGRILELATGECGIKASNLHIGGPPADNVAIDEEGASTLLRLVSLSLLIGVGLSYMSFRSFRVTVMLFFVGGVAAMSSLAYVWFAGSTMDAILMSMPSLVYVLGLSGAVHIVNYYRDACHESGPDLAVETAVKHGWFPCTLAAFTTALGLISLCTSSLTPINKFGFFSAIATMATVLLLFTLLPAALTIWSPGYKKRESTNIPDGTIADAVGRFWRAVGEWVIGHHAIVTVVTVLVMIFFSWGIFKIKTSVHLLKLFDSKAKILQDYSWMEDNLGKLVPAEVIVSMDADSQKERWFEQQKDKARLAAIEADEEFDEESPFEKDELEYDLKYSLLERIELSNRIRKQLERFFGPDGLDIVGSGMSTDVFVPLQFVDTQLQTTSAVDRRSLFNTSLKAKYNEMLSEQYLARVDESNGERERLNHEAGTAEKFGREMWRISIRLAALNNVDYGSFVNDLKTVIEPILTAYRYRTQILKRLQAELGEDSLTNSQILILGPRPDPEQPDIDLDVDVDTLDSISEIVDQTYIFGDTLSDLLENRGYEYKILAKDDKHKKRYYWLDPSWLAGDKRPTPDELAQFLKSADCVIMVKDDPLFDEQMVRDNSRIFIDCREHRFDDADTSGQGALTAVDRNNIKPGEVDISAIYTGIVPIVYKAQNQLLVSLIRSIGLAFCMIAMVMMLLLRNWREPIGPANIVNIRGGMTSMLPNVFPIVMIFGAMGHLKLLVDIGSMMTASVAMGVAVDDTIHYLNWYRQGLARGLNRLDSIRLAYDRVATAMTQTTLIGGLGLSAFALSTFTPTQRFGVLMLVLLTAALVGDLILLPAILAGPLGRFFGKEQPQNQADEHDEDHELRVINEEDLLPEHRPDNSKDIKGPPPDKLGNDPAFVHPEVFRPPVIRCADRPRRTRQDSMEGR